MIVVDTSAWVEFLRRTESAADLALTRLLESESEVACTEVVFAELLVGARSRDEMAEVRTMLLGFPVLALGGIDGYEAAADLCRACRQAGEPLGSITDALVAVPAIRAEAPVLHNDADFEKLARHTPLDVVEL